MKETIKETVYNNDLKKDYKSFWWTVPENEIYSHLSPLIRDIKTKQEYQTLCNLRNARLYQNLELLGIYSGFFSNNITNTNRVNFNVIGTCVDTASSKIAKMKTRPMFLTDDGDWEQQKKAELLTQYMDGQFDEMRIYEEFQKMFIDSCVFGTGFVKFYVKDSKVKCERVIVEEIIVEDGDGLYNNPSQLYQVKLVNKDYLKKQYPEFKFEIEQAREAKVDDYQRNTRLIKVFEAWKLPSSEGADDGHHAIVIDTCTLFSEKYEKNYFPFVKLTWKDRLTGYYGMGIAEMLQGIQLELNKFCRIISKSLEIACVPRVFVESTSSINKQALSNAPGAIVEYTGKPPQFNTAQALSPEVYSYVNNLYQKAFEETGISMLSATSQKPAGLNSGVALRTHQDIESERFQLVSQRYEQSFITACKIIIDLQKDILESGEKPTVKVMTGEFMKQINWKDVYMKDDEYILKVYPTSILPTTPSGKLQTTQELMQMGFLDKNEAMSLLDFPDLKRTLSMKNSKVNNVRDTLFKMLNTGELQPVLPFEDIQMNLQMAVDFYLSQKLKNAPNDKLDIINDYINQCKDLLTKAQQDAIAQQQAMQPPQMAMPPQ